MASESTYLVHSQQSAVFEELRGLLVYGPAMAVVSKV